MNNNSLTIAEFAAKIDRSIRYVHDLCAAGRIPGARKEIIDDRYRWVIPIDAMVQPLTTSKTKLARAMLAQGMQSKEIVAALGVTRSLVSHAKKRSSPL